ncbi:MAG: thermonuclease family protein, partial [Candidatus Nanopelagicales bacterium]
MTVLCLGALSVVGAAAHAAPSTPFPFPDYSTVDYTQVPIQETGVVDVVADGDTFRFIEDGSSSYVTVRLLGINTPEVRGFYNKNREE